MTRSVLILSSKTDPHATTVSDQLTQMGCSSHVWQPGSLLSATSLTHRPGHYSTIKLENGKKIELDKVDSIWFRRPGTVKPLPAVERWVEAMAANESDRGLQGVLRSTSAFHVNDPACQDAIRYKLHQLTLASQCGFKVPDTLIGNSPDCAKEFYEVHSGNVVYKLIDESTAQFLPTFRSQAPLFTSAVESEDLLEFDSVAKSLHLFQQLIKKKFDVRLTVVHEAIFAARILSQQGQGSLDFRRDYNVPIETFEVSDDLACKVLKLMSRAKLVFGCIDLAIDNTGEAWFFEINPQGQFLWIEDALGYSLSKELAMLLKNGSA